MTKLIELDKVLEIVKSYFSIDYAFQDFILNEISKLPTTESNSENGWISVNDMLPGNDGYYMVAVNYPPVMVTECIFTL